MNLFRNSQEKFKFFLKNQFFYTEILLFRYENAPKSNKMTDSGGTFRVRLIGLEPTRPESPDPKSGASANSATSAFCQRAIL